MGRLNRRRRQVIDEAAPRPPRGRASKEQETKRRVVAVKQIMVKAREAAERDQTHDAPSSNGKWGG